MEQLVLSEGWRLRRWDPAQPLPEALAEPSGWIAATAPGSVHEALLAAGQIPDPFYGLNELEVLWVGEADWLYSCDFELSAEQAGQPAALCCDGLDTIATVWLNGVEVAQSENMFVPVRASAGGLLRAGRNTLAILFRSALRHGKALEAELGFRPVWNPEPSRVYVRKAQYHYGWDWGPSLITAGPWRPVRLELGAARIADLSCPIEVSESLGAAALAATLELDGGAALAGLTVRLTLADPAGVTIGEATLPAAPVLTHSFAVAAPQLWWPAGQGGQPLYSLGAELLDAGGAPVDRAELRLGLRRLRLVQEPVEGEPGSSFLFEINGRPIFCGGANWIPADSFTTRLTRETYSNLLTAAVAANMNMLRIWGGGIYEDPAFYELCDELGLLVWQDFMFACGMYPAHETYLASVRAEAEAQLRRLRNYACIVIWCGNNEDYQIAESLKAYNPALAAEENTAFSGRLIYERVLPEVCAALDPTRPYWPGSPYAGVTTSDGTVGDRHVWDIWHGGMAAYQRYGEFAGRFVSEFGMQGCPDPVSLRPYLPPGEDRPQSRVLDHHNKAVDGPKRLAAYLAENLRATDLSLETYSYDTQLIQAEAVSHAYRAWRRRWHGPGRYAVAGALVWQLDDCWPVISWALIDWSLRPKAALYATRRELAPLAVGLAPAPGGAAAWAVNANPEPVAAAIELKAYSLDGAVVELGRREATLPALGTLELGGVELPQGGPWIVGARLLVGDAVVSRATLWPEPLKYLDLPDPGLSVTSLPDERVALRCVRPAKAVWLTAGDGVAWEDNSLDLLPDEERVVAAPGLGGRPVGARWLGI